MSKISGSSPLVIALALTGTLLCAPVSWAKTGDRPPAPPSEAASAAIATSGASGASQLDANADADAVATAAGDAPPMSAQDLVTMPRLSGPVADKNGTFAIYAVTRTDRSSYERSASYYWQSLSDLSASPVPIDLGGEASDLAIGGDGWLYFLSDRAAHDAEPKQSPAPHGAGDKRIKLTEMAGASAKPASPSTQLWRAAISPAGKVGAVEQVSNLPGTITGFRLSPDASRVVIYGPVARSCQSFGCPDGSTEQPGPGSGRLYNGDVGFIRHWDAWETPGVYNRGFAFPIIGGKLAGGGAALDGPPQGAVLTGDTPTVPFGGSEEIAWAPDNSGVYFVARQANADEPMSTNLDIWWNDLAGGAPTNLTANNLATDSAPAPSPDGRWLAWLAMARPGYESDRQVIHLRDTKSNKTTALTADFDRSFGSLTWTSDSRYILATAQDVLDTPAFRIDPQNGAVEKLDLMAGNEAHIGSLTPLPGSNLLFTRDSIGGPPDLLLSQNWQQARPASNVAGAELGARAAVRTSRFSFKGAGGDTVWGQITRLDKQTGPIPAILYVHGGPQGSFNDSWSSRWNPRVVASQGYAVISVDFHGSTGYGQAFTDSINRDWGGKPLIDLQKGLAAALKVDPQIDGSRACAMGASYGGYMMNWIAGKWPTRFRCLVQHDGVFDSRAMAYETEELWFDTWDHGGKFYFETPEEYERWNPVNHVANWQTPMLVITGEKDFRIPYTQGIASFTALQMRKIPSQLLVFPDENHWVLKPKNSLQWHDTVFGWLARWLKGAPVEGAQHANGQ